MRRRYESMSKTKNYDLGATVGMVEKHDTLGMLHFAWYVLHSYRMFAMMELDCPLETYIATLHDPAPYM